MVGAAIARSTRSGTFVGPGIWRKCRPLWYAMTMSSPRSAELAEALRRVVGGEVRFDSYTRHLFSRDASMYSIEPIGVVFPRDSSDVAAVVSTAAEFGVPVLPRGAGTSLAGQTVGQAIVLDLSRHMSQIIEIDAERRVARVQPGVVQEQLNLAAGRHGLVFGPDSSSWAGPASPCGSRWPRPGRCWSACGRCSATPVWTPRCCRTGSGPGQRAAVPAATRPVPVYIGAMGPKMLEMAGRHLSFGPPLGPDPLAALRLLGDQVLPALAGLTESQEDE